MRAISDTGRPSNVSTGKTGGKTGGKAGGGEAGKSQKSHSAKAGLQVRAIGEGNTMYKAANSVQAGASQTAFHGFLATGRSHHLRDPPTPCRVLCTPRHL